jgi:RNA polymerase sigma factor (sigma-70 family)
MYMRDGEIVASIVAGDPSGLAAAYDRYAEPLYKYCRSMLSNPSDAADAVQDTFVIAACRLAELRDPDRLRAWLYAVARNECLQILGAGRPAPPITVPPGMTDTVIDITEGAAERAELRALLTTAARGLNAAEREVLELQLRQGLETAEVADVLGVSRGQAAALASRARD